MRGLKQYFIQYFSNNITALLYVAFILLSIVPASYLIVLGADTRFLLDLMIRMIPYYMIIFLVSGYLYLNKDKRNGLNELFQTYTKDSSTFIKKASMILSILLFSYLCLLFVLLVITAFLRNELYVFNLETIKAFLYLIILPSYLFLILVILISFIMNTRISLSLFILLVLVNSPLFERFESNQSTHYFINLFIQIIYFPFNLFIYHGEIVLDTLYGYQTELYKIGIFVFWLLILIYMFYRKHINKKVLIIPLALFIFISYTRINTSLLRLSNSALTTYYDYQYYQNKNRNYGYHQVTDSIDRYDLSFDFHNQMKVSGSMIINTKTKNSVLTLYHKYRIKELVSKNLNTFKQVGDYIYLSFKQPVTHEKLRITYQGFSDKFYSSSKAVCLPSYFPYYPFIGKQNIYCQNKNLKFTNYGYNVYLKQKAYYHITSNLPLYISSNNRYADNLTLLYGNMRKESKSTFINSYPLEFTYFISKQDIENDFNSSVNKIKINIKNLYHIDIKELDKKVIFLPKSINFSEANPTISINTNYLLTSQRNLDIRDYLVYRLFNNNQISDGLKYALLVTNNNLQFNDYYEELINQLKTRDNNQKIIHILENNTKKYSRKDTLNKLGKLIFENATWKSQFKD